MASSKPSDLEQIFENLKGQGKNSVDYIINWMKQAHIINETFTEEQARNALDGATDKVTYDQFKNVLDEASKHLEESAATIHSKMADEGNKLMSSVQQNIKSFFKGIISKEEKK